MKTLNFVVFTASPNNLVKFVTTYSIEGSGDFFAMKDEQLLALVAKASKGDEKAFAKLCSQRAREVIYLCSLKMQNYHDAQDAAQEVFIQMQRSITQLRAPEAFNVWLNRLVRNVCASMKRDAMRRKDTLTIESFDAALWEDDSEFALPQEYMEDAEKRSQVAEAVANLPDKYRDCVVMHYYQRLSYAQIAEVMGIPVDAVNNNMRMARKYLKLELEEGEGSPARLSGALPAMVAGGPLLALSLTEASVQAVPQGMVTQCLAAAGVSAPHPLVAAAKVLLPLAIAVAIAAGVVYAVLPQAPAAGTTAAPSVSQPGLPASSAAASQAPPVLFTAPVGGTVSLEGAGALSGATVALCDADSGTLCSQAETTPAQPGAFQFADVPAGRYRLCVTLPDYAGDGNPQSVWVTLNGAQDFTLDETTAATLSGLDIRLDLPARVTGRLDLYQAGEPVSFESHEALPTFQLQLLDPSGQPVAHTQAAADGSYSFGAVYVPAPGSYTVRVTAAAPEAAVETQDLQLWLYPGYTK